MIVRPITSTPFTTKGFFMTIKINVGVNKKIGLPDYGSAGGHCNIELEADNSILDNAEQFLQRVNDAYELARQSVEEELSHHRPGNTAQSRAETQQPRQEYRQESRQEYRNDNSRSDNNSGGGGNRIASAKQQQFIASLVKAVKGLNWQTLDRYCNSKWGANTSQLSPKQASELIDDLRDAKEGRRTIAV
jgi:hypothetical protein